MFHSFHVTINFVHYSVDSRLSEKHNFIFIAISDGSNHNSNGLYPHKAKVESQKEVSFFINHFYLLLLL